MPSADCPCIISSSISHTVGSFSPILPLANLELLRRARVLVFGIAILYIYHC
ncbi:hypothetical protein BHE74_00011229 [Ensete ventricosum]|nr:hypothetical protein BHE74_00011229 [Ensete ventricosum]